MIESSLNIVCEGNKKSAVIKWYKEKGIDPSRVKVYELTDNIPFEPMRFIRKEGAKYNKTKYGYFPVAFDTETSYIDESVGWVYQWCLRVNNTFVGGRTPSEFIELIKRLKKFYKLSDERKLVFYAHNLPYDYQYLKMSLKENFGTPKIIATAPHRIISAEYDFFIMKDSYVLANCSLEKWGKDLQTNVQKVVGGIDYNVVRFQSSQLDQKDWFYQLNDVETLFQCVTQQIKMHHDTIAIVPLTATGYVRRDARREFMKDKENRVWFNRVKLTSYMYNLCHFAYRGAYTHGNRHLRDKIIKHPVGHRDYRSFYPSVCMCDKFPIGKFERDLTVDTEWIIRNLDKYACLCQLRIKSAKLKQGITAPTLSKEMIKEGSNTKPKIIADNGRVLSFEGDSTITITELDLDLLLRQYDVDMELVDCYTSRKGKLPEFLQNITKEYFKGKTVFKQQSKQEGLKEEKLFDILKSLSMAKGKLNAIYGMLATAIIRDNWNFNFDTMEWFKDNKDNDVVQLEKYYKKRSSFAVYQLGTWITANCRHRLIVDMIEHGCGYERFIYADTDSIFYLKDDETEKIYNNINQRNYEERLKNGEYILDLNNEPVEFMAFEDENDDIQQFKFLHSKCYGCVNSKGELKVTIAGVTQFYREDLDKPIKERRTREQELVSLENLKQGTKFIHCGGTRSVYNETYPHIEFINGHKVEVESSCIIVDNEKTLNDCETGFGFVDVMFDSAV